MDRKKGIIFLCAVVLVMMAAGYFLSKDHIHPSDLASIKAAVEEEFIKLAGSEEVYAQNPIVWFDENGEKREKGVYRYFGTYGDCVVFFYYVSNVNDSGDIAWNPVRITGTREVMAPNRLKIYVVNRNPKCKTFDVWPTVRFSESISDAVRDLNWLTERQAEQIAIDLEAWFAEGNY